MNPFGGALKMEKSAHAQTSRHNGAPLTICIITNIGPIETILFLNHIYIQCAIYSTYFQPYTSYIGDATDDGSNTIVILWFYLFFRISTHIQDTDVPILSDESAWWEHFNGEKSMQIRHILMEIRTKMYSYLVVCCCLSVCLPQDAQNVGFSVVSWQFFFQKIDSHFSHGYVV